MKHVTHLYIFIVITLVTSCLYIFNMMYEERADKEKLTEQLHLLFNKQMQYMESIRYPLGDRFPIISSDGRNMNLDSVVQHARLALYIDNRNCTSCWKKEIRRLEQICDTLHLSEFPVIIANNFTQRECALIQDDCRFPVYNIGNQPDFLCPLTKFNVPFFCIIEKDMSVRFPYFPGDREADESMRRYFDYVRIACAIPREVHGSSQTHSLFIVNDIIDFGEISVRTKASARFQLQNDGGETCHLLDCMPSCSCILIDSFSRIIPPGSIGYVAFTAIKNTKGSFHHTINIKTDYSSQPILLSFRGECK